jgi:hypothetical protein
MRLGSQKYSISWLTLHQACQAYVRTVGESHWQPTLNGLPAAGERSLGRKEAGCIWGHEQVPKLPYSVIPAKVSSAHLASLHVAGV